MANLQRRPFWDLRRGIDDLFDDFLSTGTSGEGLSDFRPSLELDENETEYHVTMELPGLKPEDVEITVDQGMLTVRGTKNREQKKTKGGVEYSERSYGSFARSIQLPRAVASDRISANFDNGVLSISVPKSEQAQPRRIRLGKSSETTGSSAEEPRTK
jgi:HSP20 family protein